MNAYLAVENGSKEVEEDLQNAILKRKVEKGKGQAIEQEEDQRRTKPRTMSPVPIEKDGKDETSFVTISSGGTYNYDECEATDKCESPRLAYITSFDELSPSTEEELVDLSCMSSNYPIKKEF